MKVMKLHLSVPALLGMALLAGCAQLNTNMDSMAPADEPSNNAYLGSVDERVQNAMAFASGNLAAKTTFNDISVNWIGHTGHFWFTAGAGPSMRMVVVNAETAETVHEVSVAQLAGAMAKAGASLSLIGADMNFSEDIGTLNLNLNGELFSCSVPVKTCSANGDDPWIEGVTSPDGKKAILRRGDNLWLETLNGETSRQLTSDGLENFGYGDWDDRGFRRVVQRRQKLPESLEGVLWAPNSRHALVLRQDLRDVPERAAVIEYVPPEMGEPIIHMARFGVPNDEMRPNSYLSIIDTQTGVVVPIAIDPQDLNDLSLYYYLGDIVWWALESDKVFLTLQDRGGANGALASVDLNTGAVSKLIEESSKFNLRLNSFDYSTPNVHVLATGNEAIWYSERSGWGHLYLYDLTTGEVTRSLTGGDWSIFDLLYVDEQNRFAYFTGASEDDRGNPNARYLYRVSLEGGEPELLTPELGDHAFSNPFGLLRQLFGARGGSISPDGKFIVDVFSSLDDPGQVLVRRVDGEVIGSIHSGDATRIKEMGWRAPERAITVAADGSTKLHAVIYKPKDFNPAMKYPVINYMYSGPQGNDIPRTFLNGIFGSATSNATALSELGMVVVVVDGRGTAYRSQEFREAFLGTTDVMGAADQVAAIKNLAEARPYMDLERVAATGHSFGGYASLRALLLYPDFYTAAVSATGPENYANFATSVSSERFFGVPGESDADAEFYRNLDNRSLIHQLEGDLMLIYGGIDENVPFQSMMMVTDALVDANKKFDLVLMPDVAHSVGRTPYAVERTLEFFAYHLGGPVEQ